MPSPAISTNDVSKAKAELDGMKRSLRAWLKFRTINDNVMAGTLTQIKKPLGYAQRAISSGRSKATEQDLADKLSALLTELMPDVTLPNANLDVNPNGAVQLAQVALTGMIPPAASAVDPSNVGSQPLSGIGTTHPWLWPVLIVGGLLIGITTAIKTAADVAKDQEEKACIEAGACTDYGFWLKAGGIIVIAWFAWKEMGVGDAVKGALKRRS